MNSSLNPAAPWTGNCPIVSKAAAQAGNRDKARLYFSKLTEMAGPGGRAPELQAVRQYLAKN